MTTKTYLETCADSPPTPKVGRSRPKAGQGNSIGSKILAVDPSTTALGYAYRSSGGAIEFGAIKIPAKGKPTRQERLCLIRSGFAALLDRVRSDTLAMYRPMVRGEAATRALWGVAGVLEATAYGYNVNRFVEATDSQVRAQYGLGTGLKDYPKAARRKVSKQRAINAATSMLPVKLKKPLTDDEAEAILLLLYIENLRNSPQ